MASADAMSRPEDTGTAAALDRRRWRGLVVMLLAAFMDIVDTTVVLIAAPTIRSDLGASYADIQWVVAAYALALGLVLVTGGRLGDILGRKRLFLSGVAVFTAASAACALAPSIGALIAARAVQGAAAGLMIPQILATVSVSWINVPVGLVALVAGAVLVAESRSARRPRLDLPGVVIVSVGLLLLLYPLIQGGELDWPGWSFAMMAAAVPVLAAFAWYQARRERRGFPLVPMSLFRLRTFVSGLGVTVVAFSTISAIFLVLTLQLQAGHGFSALEVGLTFMAWPIGLAATSTLAVRLAPSLGRRLISAGTLTLAAAMVVTIAMIHRGGAGLGAWHLVPGLAVGGLGFGLVAPIAVDIVLSAVPEADAGAASGVTNTAIYVGIAAGVAVIGAVFTTLLERGRGIDAAASTALWYPAAAFALAFAFSFALPARARAPRDATPPPPDRTERKGAPMPTRTPVLVVGGGVVGLTTALFLANHGQPCVLVERHPDLLVHPRSRGLTPRTMEVYRQAGLEQAILEAAYAGPGFAWEPVKADTLSDATYERPEEPAEDDGSGASPCGFGPIDQDKLEHLLRDRASSLGAELRFHTELRSFGQDGRTVTATLADHETGTTETLEADYLVGADGYHSPVRQALGIEVDGPGPMFTTMTAIVDADLNAALGGRAASIAYLQQPRPFTILMAHDDKGTRWVFGTGYDPRSESLEDFTDARVAEMVRAAAGLPDVEVRVRPQIPGTDIKVLGFPIGGHIARAYRAGRVFLAGDAAHVWPPTGGLGANTGIQDAHNLAWKLAMTLGGQAGPGLLDTYDSERRPVGALTMGQALARFGSRMGPDAGPELIDYGAVSMGYRYPVDGSGHDGTPLLPAELRGQPGTRAPHVPVTVAGRALSTLDLFGAGLVLLCGPAGQDWAGAAARLDVPVDSQQVPTDVAKAYGLDDDGASLVRPDGFVAWRSPSAVPDPPAALTAAVDGLLHRHES